MATKIQVQKVIKSNFDSSKEVTGFASYFTDHMLVADYADGVWQDVRIVPYAPIEISPVNMAIHYGQSIFEGIKAYLNKDGEAVIFRPYENFKRFNRSAERMEMPTVPEEIFIEGMRTLINLEKQWIPNGENQSMYIRPFMFATDASLGVRPSTSYKFMIVLSPSGAYYAQPSKILVEEKYTRAAPGGVGEAKNAGNYAASLKAAENAKKQGFDQVLWTDAFEHKWLQEVGTMNVMFVFDNKIVTPSLEEGTILPGITRDSAIVVLKEEMGWHVEERKISIDELLQAYKTGTLKEMFGTGTAATVALIKALKYKDELIELDVENAVVAKELAMRLTNIRSGLAEDKYGWIFKV